MDSFSAHSLRVQLVELTSHQFSLRAMGLWASCLMAVPVLEGYSENPMS